MPYGFFPQYSSINPYNFLIVSFNVLKRASYRVLHDVPSVQDDSLGVVTSGVVFSLGDVASVLDDSLVDVASVLDDSLVDVASVLDDSLVYVASLLCVLYVDL